MFLDQLKDKIIAGPVMHSPNAQNVTRLELCGSSRWNLCSVDKNTIA